MKKYRFYEMNILSEMELEGPEVEFESPDVTIVFGETPKSIEGERAAKTVLINDHEVLIQIPKIANYYMTHANHIIVEPIMKDYMLAVKMYFVGRVFSTLLVQRGLVPFHGSALCIENKGVLITGKSGAGKTSITSGLINRGYKILTDDIIAFDNSDSLKILPGFSHQKLHPELVERYNLQDHIITYADYPGKSRPEYYLDRTNEKRNQKHSVDIVVLMVPSNENYIEEYTGMDKMDLILRNVYGGYLTEYFNNHLDRFEIYSQLAKRVRFFVLKRKRGEFSVEEQIELLLEKIMT